VQYTLIPVAKKKSIGRVSRRGGEMTVKEREAEREKKKQKVIERGIR
jgi:hypothetical protein